MVRLPPSLQRRLCSGQIVKPVQVQVCVPKRTMERLDIGIVGRLAGPTEHQGDLMLIRLQVSSLLGMYQVLKES